MYKVISPLARKAVIAGRKEHYRFRPVQEETYKMGWVCEDIPEDTRILSERLRTLKTDGIKVKRVFIAHEAPRLLPAPKAEPKQDFKVAASIPNSVDLVQGLIEVVVPLLIFVVPMFMELFVQMILLDPAYVVELEDGSLVEVMQCYE